MQRTSPSVALARASSVPHTVRDSPVMSSPLPSSSFSSLSRMEDETEEWEGRSFFFSAEHRHQVWRSTTALWILRNLCFHSKSKTMLCQDGRLLFTLKAALLRLPTVLALVVDPEELEKASLTPFTPAVLQRLASLSSSHTRAFSMPPASASGGGRSMSPSRARRHCRRTRPPSVCGPASSVGLSTSFPSGGSVFLEWGQRWRGKAEQWVYWQRKQHESLERQSADRTASSSSPRTTSAVGKASPTASSGDASLPLFSVPLVLSMLFHAEWASGRRSSVADGGAWESVLESDATRKRGGGGGWWGPPVTDLYRRQQLAASALWALLHDHPKGKAYVRRVLRHEAPEVRFPSVSPPPPLSHRTPEAEIASRDGYAEHGKKEGKSWLRGTKTKTREGGEGEGPLERCFVELDALLSNV